MELNELIELGYRYYPTAKDKVKLDRNDVIDIHFEAFSNLSDEKKEKYKNENINDGEFFAFVLLIGFAAHEIQNPLRNNTIPNKFIQQILILLDSFLLKVERTTERTLFRQDKYSDIKDFAESEIISFPTFLNASIDNYKSSSNIVWVITPLVENSCGHDVYKIYDHGNEKQITFERGSSFLINTISIESHVNYIYCEEIIK